MQEAEDEGQVVGIGTKVVSLFYGEFEAEYEIVGETKTCWRLNDRGSTLLRKGSNPSEKQRYLTPYSRGRYDHRTYYVDGVAAVVKARADKARADKVRYAKNFQYQGLTDDELIKVVALLQDFVAIRKLQKKASTDGSESSKEGA